VTRGSCPAGHIALRTREALSVTRGAARALAILATRASSRSRSTHTSRRTFGPPCTGTPRMQTGTLPATHGGDVSPARHPGRVAVPLLHRPLLTPKACSALLRIIALTVQRTRNARRPSRKVDAPEILCKRVTTALGRRAIPPRTLALGPRICQPNRQSPRRLVVRHQQWRLLVDSLRGTGGGRYRVRRARRKWLVSPSPGVQLRLAMRRV
jgi:hypothetical protein